MRRGTYALILADGVRCPTEGARMTGSINRPIAHAARAPDGTWRAPHDLAEHLAQVGRLAGHFAQHYGTDWARLAGRWHDLGKYRPRFQHYIRQASGFEADAHIRGEAGCTAFQSQRANHAA